MQSGTPRKMPRITRIRTAFATKGSRGSGEIPRTAAQATRMTRAARSPAEAFTRFTRRPSWILRNSATVSRRDRVTRSPAHQSCAASVMHARELPDGLLGAARRPLDLLQRLGEREQLRVGLVEVDDLAERLTHLVRSRVVELDPVVLRIVEVDAAGDPVGDRAVDLHALLLEPMVEGTHVVECLHLERDLLHVVRLLPRLPGLHQRQLVMLGVGRRAQKADAPLQVLVADRQAQDLRVEAPHLRQVVAEEPDVAQPADLRHVSPLRSACKTWPHCPTGASSSCRA